MRWEEFLLLFRWLATFWRFFKNILRRTLYNTWKSHYRQLKVPTMVFNKKALVNISSISNSRNLRWNILSFVSRHCVKNVQIRSYFWSVFSPNAGKYGPEITPYLDTFRAVRVVANEWLKTSVWNCFSFSLISNYW